jgi:hypothetical protein
MKAKLSRTKAFGLYGVILRNPNWSLSGRSPDGRTVAVSIWSDELSLQDGKLIYDRPNWGDWYDGPGRRFLFKDLAWARDFCGGIVRPVLSVRNPSADGVQTAGAQARTDLFMKLTRLDPDLGGFRLEQVTPIGS